MRNTASILVLISVLVHFSTAQLIFPSLYVLDDRARAKVDFKTLTRSREVVDEDYLPSTVYARSSVPEEITESFGDDFEVREVEVSEEITRGLTDLARLHGGNSNDQKIIVIYNQDDDDHHHKRRRRPRPPPHYYYSEEYDEEDLPPPPPPKRRRPRPSYRPRPDDYDYYSHEDHHYRPQRPKRPSRPEVVVVKDKENGNTQAIASFLNKLGHNLNPLNHFGLNKKDDVVVVVNQPSKNKYDSYEDHYDYDHRPYRPRPQRPRPPKPTTTTEPPVTDEPEEVPMENVSERSLN